jgi:hypothetical protein
MSKFAYTVLGTVAVVVAIAGTALGASSAAKCGHLYQPKCKKPAIGGKTVTVKCHKVGTTFTVPTLTLRAVAGLKSITITVHSTPRTLLALTHLHGATQKVIHNLRVNTRGLAKGPHVIVVKVVDLRNATATQLLPFAVCVPPKPRTTG